MKKLKGAQYLIVAAGIVVVLAIVLTVSFKKDVRLTCNLIKNQQTQLSYHFLNVLYSVKRLDEGKISVYLGDKFRFRLDTDTLRITYIGKCDVDKRIITLDHNIKNVDVSVSTGNVFCVEKKDNKVRLC